MAFVHKCPDCSQRLKVREEFLGKRFACPKCGGQHPLKKVRVQRPERVPVVDEADLPPMVNALPPVAKTVREADVRPPVEEKKERRDDFLYGRAETLGRVDEDEWAAQQKTKKMVMGGMAGLMLLLAVGFAISNGSFASAESYLPTDFKKHAGPQDQFTLVLPDDWQSERGGGGAKAPPWFRAKGRKVSLSVRANPRASIMGSTAQVLDDLALANGLDPAEQPPESQPIHGVHMQLRDLFALNYSGYEEEPPKVVDTGVGSARYSRFSGRTAIGMKETGFRGSVMVGPYAYIVECKMPGWLMDEFEPFYQDILESFSP